MTVNIVTICSDYLYPVITLIYSVYRIIVFIIFSLLSLFTLAHFMCNFSLCSAIRASEPLEKTQKQKPKQNEYRTTEIQKNNLHSPTHKICKPFVARNMHAILFLSLSLGIDSVDIQFNICEQLVWIFSKRISMYIEQKWWFKLKLLRLCCSKRKGALTAKPERWNMTRHTLHTLNLAIPQRNWHNCNKFSWTFSPHFLL